LKIYTKRGDGGTTSLGNGESVAKNDRRVAALGDVDELNCTVGVIRSLPAPEIDNTLARVQSLLFDLGSNLANPDRTLPEESIEQFINDLEGEIDSFTTETPPLRNFILPGGSLVAAQLHFARAVCRRAERSVINCRDTESEPMVTIRFLNRLSDWMFAAARWQNQNAGVADVIWRPET